MCPHGQENIRHHDEGWRLQDSAYRRKTTVASAGALSAALLRLAGAEGARALLKKLETSDRAELDLG